MNKQKVKQIVKVAKTVVKAKLHISVIQTDKLNILFLGLELKKKKIHIYSAKMQVSYIEYFGL